MAKEVWRPGNMLYPIPAVMVSCQREGEKPNIITVAWAGNVCTNPAMLSISVRKERYSYNIIKESGEFVVNLTNKQLTRAADWCGVRSGRDYDKFKEMNLTPQKSQEVSCPGIEESPVNIECKLHSIIELGSHDLFIGEVKCVTVDGKYMDEKGKFELNKAGLVAYSHGEYFTLGEKLGKFGYSVVKKETKTGKKKSVKEGNVVKKKTAKPGDKSNKKSKR
jgi:flavin reductase (DIM6/NTAB) family NADH-FMN oxidoreductase RutF